MICLKSFRSYDTTVHIVIDSSVPVGHIFVIFHLNCHVSLKVTLWSRLLWVWSINNFLSASSFSDGFFFSRFHDTVDYVISTLVLILMIFFTISKNFLVISMSTSWIFLFFLSFLDFDNFLGYSLDDSIRKSVIVISSDVRFSRRPFILSDSSYRISKLVMTEQRSLFTSRGKSKW